MDLELELKFSDQVWTGRTNPTQNQNLMSNLVIQNVRLVFLLLIAKALISTVPLIIKKGKCKTVLSKSK